MAAVPGRALLGALLSWAMAAATASIVTLPVVASFIIDDFDITRAEFGFLITSLTVGGAVASPYAGRIADRIGGRNAMIAVFVSAATAAVLYAVAPVFGAMFAGSAVALTGAAANPGTNKLIAEHAPVGQQGFLTGIKQTGPQIGSFLAGVLAPIGAASLGWRPTVALIALLTLAPIPLVLAFIPADVRISAAEERARPPLPPGIGWLGLIAALVGIGSSSSFLLPLFVEEGLGQGNRAGGAAAALQGAVAIFGRVAWARAAEQIRSPWLPSALIGVLAIVSVSLMVAAISFGIGWMWIGTVISAISSSSWTAVGALAVITLVGARAAGRATGLVWLGFLGGLGIGPPFYGWLVDRTGTYSWTWFSAGVVFVLLVVATVAWGRALGRNTGDNRSRRPFR